MSFLFPLGMAALGALVPLLVLYLLKQKRVEMRVPTNFLWATALEDLRASSLFQRFRTQILLLLQALALILFALAAAGASLRLDLGETPRHVIVLLDRSQSMKAQDEPGRTRFDVAVELARDAVSGLRGGDEMMILTFDADVSIAISFTGDKDRLEDVLDGLEAQDLPSRAGDALRLALSYGQAAKGFDTEVLLLSDGAIADELPDLPFPLTYARVGTSGDNQGIAAAHLARTPGEPSQLFVRVVNGSPNAAQRGLVLRLGKEVIDARDLVLEPGGDAQAFFELPELEEDEPIVVTVALSGKDVLAEDDSIPLVLRPVVPRSGLLVELEPSLYLDPDKLTELHPGLALVTATPEEAEAMFTKGGMTVDFVLFNQVEPTKLPPVPAQLYVNALPPDSGLVSVGVNEFPIIIDWDRTHPATVRCHFDDVIVREAMKLQGTERSHTLVESTGGPIALLTPVPGREVVVLAFPPEQSNLPLKLAWPLFLANTMDFLLAGVQRPGEETLSTTGTPLTVTGEGTLEVETPSGRNVEVPADAGGRASLNDTTEAGVYRVDTEERTGEPRAYALLDADEIAVAPLDKVVLGADRAVDSDPAAIARNVLLRDPLLLLALGILVLEWAIWCGRR